MNFFEQAYAAARDGHQYQWDKAGRPYIEHIDRVIERTRLLIQGLPEGQVDPALADAILATAALHDLVEDGDVTGYTYETLEAKGFPQAIIARVRRLDKRYKIGTYANNIEAIAIEGDIGVIMVKLADNLDNSDPERIAVLPPSERSIKDRYDRVRPFLVAAYEQAGGRYLGP
jgi:(p)ppGpp synthase/HD superfamily hydrolase